MFGPDDDDPKPPNGGGSRLAAADMRTWKLFDAYYQRFGPELAAFLVFGEEGKELRNAARVVDT